MMLMVTIMTGLSLADLMIEGEVAKSDAQDHDLINGIQSTIPCQLFFKLNCNLYLGVFGFSASPLVAIWLVGLKTTPGWIKI